ncbi:MAG TPA: MmcQ/YjbR family DNA-binding protein [Gemmataceae bacterium]|nr:MmcQ/YjbR family DNA-binding protein [Gemmataceae bacterium]
MKARTCNWETVRALALALPGVEESTSYGTPAFKVRGKLFVRLKEDAESIVLRIDETDRAMRLQADPRAFYLTDHYVKYPWMLVRLSAVAQDDLAELLRDAWRLQAPARLAVEYDRTEREPGAAGASRRAPRRRK